jgi:hypothetical protein
MMSEKLRGQSLLVATMFTSAVSMVMRTVRKAPSSKPITTVTSEDGPRGVGSGAARDVWTTAAFGDLSFSAADCETPTLWSPP